MAKLSDVIASNRDTFNVLVYFSVLMFGLSLGSFFLISRTAVGDFFAKTQANKDVAGAIAAVLSANIVIALYVVFAFNETPDQPRPAAARPAEVGADDAASAAGTGVGHASASSSSRRATSKRE